MKNYIKYCWKCNIILLLPPIKSTWINLFVCAAIPILSNDLILFSEKLGDCDLGVQVIAKRCSPQQQCLQASETAGNWSPMCKGANEKVLFYSKLNDSIFPNCISFQIK